MGRRSGSGAAAALAFCLLGVPEQWGCGRRGMMVGIGEKFCVVGGAGSSRVRVVEWQRGRSRVCCAGFFAER